MEQIAELRRERGWSQVKLGAKAEVNPSTVNQIERGMRHPNSSTLEKLAVALEVEVAELFSPKGQPPPPEQDERRIGEWEACYIVLGRDFATRSEKRLKDFEEMVDPAAMEESETPRKLGGRTALVVFQIAFYQWRKEFGAGLLNYVENSSVKFSSTRETEEFTAILNRLTDTHRRAGDLLDEVNRRREAAGAETGSEERRFTDVIADYKEEMEEVDRRIREEILA